MEEDIDSYMNEGYSAYDGVPSDYRAPAVDPAASKPAAVPQPAPAPRAPAQPSVQNFAPPLPRTGPMVSVLFRGLGDFDITGRCAIVALSRVAWLFWSKLADGQTNVALGVLELYRTLWNLKREAIASGFIGHGIEHLPGMLPAAQWTRDMRYSMAYSIAGATGFHSDIGNVLARMPDTMASLAPWFQTLTATLPAADLPSARVYVDAPLPSSGDPIVYYAGYVRDDLSRCGTSAPAPTYTPTAPQSQTSAPFRPTASGGSMLPGTSPGGSSSGGTSNLAMLLMIALLGYGGYLAYQDSKPKETE